MLRWRLISAAIILSVIVALVWLDVVLGSADSLNKPGLMVGFISIVIGLMASQEVLNFNCKNNCGVKRWAVYGGTLLVVGLANVPLLYESYPTDCPVGRLGWPLFGMAGAIGMAFVSQMIGYQKDDQVLDDVARTVMVVGYIGLLLSFWAPLRSLIDNHWGMVALLSLYVPVKMSDSLAYTVGKIWGKHKLAPVLSPGKTVQGMLGGIVGGCLGAVLVFYWLAPRLTGSESGAMWWQVLVFGIIVTLVGIVGDLCESLLKRDGGVKNSSRWLPGLGGVMDIVDSVLPAGPAVYAFWATGWFGPMS